MSEELHRVQSVFMLAIDGYQPDEWPAFLKEVCRGNEELRAEVDRLLQAHVEMGSIHTSTPGWPLVANSIDQAHEALGNETQKKRIGPYKLLQQIGEGGMGVVYMAEQTEPVKRRVALKIIKPGMDTRQVVARFEAERQALAMMDHPCIARVLDGGQTESGRPYFVMELVHGLAVTDYCDQRRLTPRERLKLFVPICQAVQHAHQKGIIHRDLKPSNVLVAVYDGQPVPKIIDFGVAKATSQALTEKTLFTHFGQMVGTPEYMSPEQTETNRQDIDTRSDIYSLGVVLYELLTGEPPFDRQRLRSSAFNDMLRIIREEEPPLPSQRLSTSAQLASSAANRRTEPQRLNALVRGELDWIVMKAIDKDRNRRYDSAGDLAEDVQHYLNEETVEACPPSAVYRFRKFARRNRNLILAVGAITATLLVGTAVSIWLAIWATSAEGRAHNRLIAERVAHDATQEAKQVALHRLFDSYLAHAQASRLSGRPGQRLASLEAVRKAAPLIPQLNLDQEAVKSLRNEAIAAMGLFDLEQQAQIPLPARDRWVSFDQTFERFASSDPEGGIGIWRVADGKRISHIPESIVPSRQGFYRRFTPNGRYLVGVGQPPLGWVWDLEQGEIVQRFKVSNSGVLRSSFRTAGDLLAYIQPDDSVLLRRLSDNTTLHSLATQARAIALSEDGAYLAVASLQRTNIEIWDCQTGLLIRVINFALANEIGWHPDGKHLACARDGDMDIHVLDIESGDTCAVLSGHRSEGLELYFNHDGSLLMSSGWDETGRLWNALGNRELVQTVGSHGHFAGKRDALALTDSDEATIWRICPSQECRTLFPGDPSRELLFSSADFWWGGLVLAAARDDGIRIWNLQTGRQLAFAPIGKTSTVLFQESTGSLISRGPSGVFRWPITVSADLNSWCIGPPHLLLDRTDERMQSEMDLAQSLDGSCIAATRDDAKAVVIDPNNLARRFVLSDHQVIESLSVSPDGRWIASRDHQQLRIWNAWNGEIVQSFPVDFGAESIAFDPRGKWLAMNQSSRIQLVDTSTWNLDREFPIRGVTRKGLCWSPDGRLIAVPRRNIVTLLDASTGELLAQLESPNEPENVQAIRFSSGGQLAIVYRTAIEVWDWPLVRKRLAEMGLDLDIPSQRSPTYQKVPQQVEFDMDTLAPPDRREKFLEQARLYAARSEWPLAAEQYNLAFDTKTTNVEHLSEIAGGLLLAGEPKKYRQACELLFSEHRQTDDDRVAYLLARTATLDDNLYQDPEAHRLAELAVNSIPSASWYLHTLGMVYYREGRYVEAVKYFEDSAERNWEANVANWIALAMAHHHLGHDEQSQQRWLQANKWLESPKALHPHDRVAVKLLHDEAEKLLNPAGNE